MNSTDLPSVDQIMAETQFRISPDVFTAAIFTFLALSILVAAYRLYLRIVAFGRPGTDDYFMIAAVLSFAGSVAVTQYSRYLLYLQMAVAMAGGRIAAGDSVAKSMIDLGRLDNAQYILEWVAIYCVKFSYLFFFKPLVSRVRIMEIWWMVLVGLCTAMALPTIFLSFWVCPHFDESFVQLCVQNGSVYVHEQILLTISTTTDITTDLLIISLPIWLLLRVKLELRRKLALGAVLCLSSVMIIIASVRYALCSLEGYGHEIPDSVWLFFWQSVECFVAIMMVSLTAFRSLYGHAKKNGRTTRAGVTGGGYYAVGASDERKAASKGLGERSILKSVHVDIRSESGGSEEELTTLEKPAKAMSIRRPGEREAWESYV